MIQDLVAAVYPDDPRTRHEYGHTMCEQSGEIVATWRLRCRDRTCPICGRVKAEEWREGLLHRVRGYTRQHQLRLVTLTVSHHIDDSLSAVYDRLMDAYRHLTHDRAHRAWWRRRVHGGAWVVELKYGRNGWHPHIHMIVEGPYMPVRDLRAHWVAAGGGREVDVASIRDPRMAAQYVTKYLAKGWRWIQRQRIYHGRGRPYTYRDLSYDDTRPMRAYVTGQTRGRRMHGYVGTWWGDGPDRPPAICPACGGPWDACAHVMHPWEWERWLEAQDRGPPSGRTPWGGNYISDDVHV